MSFLKNLFGSGSTPDNNNTPASKDSVSTESRGSSNRQEQRGKSENRSARERKLSFREKQELESLPEKIETLESQISDLHQEMANPDFYQQAKDKIAAAQERLTQLNRDLESAFARWEELEAIG